jgi:hypothetical protein
MEIFLTILAIITIAALGGVGFFVYQMHQKLTLPDEINKTEQEDIRKEHEREKESLQAKIHTAEQEKAVLQTRFEQILQRTSELEAKHQTTEKTLHEKEGKGKQLFVQITKIQEENKALQEKNEFAFKTKAELDQRVIALEKQTAQNLTQLESAKKSFEAEKVRIQDEEKAKAEHQYEEKQRMWNEHENRVLANLKEIVQKPAIGFPSYDNTNLPAEFSGRFKPDFMISFLGQYMIWDAKKSKDIANYINAQVKTTATKIKNRDDIYPTVFFVIPTEELPLLRKTYFFEDGISFFVVSVEACEPIMAAYKRITEYDQIKDFDPQDRDAIVNLIANYDRHLSFRNATDVLLTENAINVMKSKESLPEELQDEIQTRKANMRSFKLPEADVKKLAQSTEKQTQSLKKFHTPTIAVKPEEINAAQSLFDQ